MNIKLKLPSVIKKSGFSVVANYTKTNFGVSSEVVEIEEVTCCFCKNPVVAKYNISQKCFYDGFIAETFRGSGEFLYACSQECMRKKKLEIKRKEK